MLQKNVVHPLSDLTQHHRPSPGQDARAAETMTEGDMVQLSRALVTHQGEQRILHLKPATFADFIELGDIDSWIATGLDTDGTTTGMRVETSYEAIMRWAMRLTSLDRHILGTLTPADAHKLMAAIRTVVARFTRGNFKAGPTS